jgi:outer membrane protein assembly factor BamE (lipoprotein component of BamABCDE complex)
MRLILLIIFLFIVNCKFDKVVDSHGIHYLDKKNKQLVVKSSNKNDIIKILGPPSTKSKFDNDVWIYIERKKTRSSLFKLGRRYIEVNNVLVLEIDSKGLLAKKELLNIDNMNELKFIEDETEISYSKRSFVYDFLSSMRQKVNDPLGVRAKKRKKIKSQQ